MLTRREFIKILAALSGSVLISPPGKMRGQQPFTDPISWEQSLLSSQASPPGEFYAGFLLLPEGTPVPSIVRYPKLGIPSFCGVGVGRGGPEPTAVVKSFNAPAELAKEVAFPVYTLSKLPYGLRPGGANLIQYGTGEVFAAVVNFQSYSIHSNGWETTMSIWAAPEFPRPFPLWSSDPVEPGGPAVILEKVDFLPAPGIMIATSKGAVFHWIKHDVLYTLIAELGLSHQETLTFVPLLSELN